MALIRISKCSSIIKISQVATSCYKGHIWVPLLETRAKQTKVIPSDFLPVGICAFGIHPLFLSAGRTWAWLLAKRIWQSSGMSQKSSPMIMIHTCTCLWVFTVLGRMKERLLASVKEWAATVRKPVRGICRLPLGPILANLPLASRPEDFLQPTRKLKFRAFS